MTVDDTRRDPGIPVAAGREERSPDPRFVPIPPEAEERSSDPRFVPIPPEAEERFSDSRFVTIPPEAEEALPPADTVTGKLGRAFFRRLPVWPLVEFLSKKKVPRHRHSFWYTIGSMALFFLVVQIVTGVLLMVYYSPSQPWSSVQRIVMEIPFGGLLRSIHHWSANLMLLALFVHLFSTFFMKAYRPPRELTWLTGLALLGTTMFLGFSGYLLPWDDLSFFATRVGISELEKMPLLGTWIAGLARGGPDVTVDTIGRFYPLHVVVLPLLLLAVLSVHLFFVQVQGVSEPDSFRALPPEQKRYHRFFSEYLVNEIPIWMALAALLVALSALFPRVLAPEADPAAAAPEGIKPEWYFMVPFQMLKLFPGSLELLGMALTGLIPVLFLVVPFVDRSVPADRRGRVATRVGVAFLVYLVAMTVWGMVS
ncbi:MAG: cytochrome bc complex cytochrome b subunit [Deltaproteobacteria bacterium]|nr:cytochrome bc complex cytochrome b subunit [Deltaproteobacteria bacterium]